MHLYCIQAPNALDAPNGLYGVELFLKTSEHLQMTLPYFMYDLDHKMNNKFTSAAIKTFKL